MATCSFYHDIEGRIYYLPTERIDAYQTDKESSNLAQECRKVLTQDGHCVRVLKNYAYPQEVQSILMRFKKIDAQEACAELGFLKVTQVDDKVGIPFVKWFLATHEVGTFKAALAERAFFARDPKLFALTRDSSFKPFEEDVEALVKEQNSEMIKLLNQHGVPVSRSPNWF